MIDSTKLVGSQNLDTDWELLSIDEAAAELGIEAKRLRGYMFRNRIGDPIGDSQHVYRFSLETLRKRIADQPAVTP